jgi:dodecin
MRYAALLFSLSHRRLVMSVAKVIEITSTSTKSFEDAIEKGIARADKTLKNVKGAWVKEQKVVVTDGKITAYRVNMLVTFVLGGDTSI